MTPRSEKRSLILVVDDEPELREILKLEFEYFGYSVMEAENGRKALEILDGNPVDLVVSDIRMPGGNGFELLNNVLAREGQRPPVILVSAFADESSADASGKGAYAYLSKPYDLDVLMEHTARALSIASQG